MQGEGKRGKKEVQVVPRFQVWKDNEAGEDGRSSGVQFFCMPIPTAELNQVISGEQEL